MKTFAFIIVSLLSGAIAGTIFGVSLGALVGIVFAYAKNRLPGSSNQKKALILTGVMFFVLFLVPALKYPPNPPAVGNPSTIYYREILYIALITISGLSCLMLAILYRKLNGFRSKNIIMPLSYSIIISVAYLILPSNPDEIAIPNDLIINFRVASVTTI